jgi:hypothetical protein
MDSGRIFAAFPSREEMARQGQAARLNSDDGVAPEAGHCYTVSPCFVHGDRSWIGHVWRVTGISGPNVRVEIVGAGYGGKPDLDHIVRADERAWYPADHLDAAP